MFKNYLLLFVVTIFLANITNSLFAEIIPIKKPHQTQEEKDQKLLIDVLKPLPKPTIKKTIKKDDTEIKKEVVSKDQKKLGIILPKKKTPYCWNAKKREN